MAKVEEAQVASSEQTSFKETQVNRSNYKEYENDRPKKRFQSWRDQNYKRRGSGGWRGGSRNDRIQARKAKVSTEALIRESALAREDKPIIFDLSSGRSKLELNDWIKSFGPTKVRRSDGVGWIYVLSPHVTAEDKKKLFESYQGIIGLRSAWENIINDPEETAVNFDTIIDLAKTHDVKSGKWIFHPRQDQVEEIWMRIVYEFAYGKFPQDVIALKISPINDLELSGGNSGQDSHVLFLINRDMTCMEQVLSAERSIRACNVRAELQYKPDIYSHLGIYRGNHFKMRPAIYHSVKDKEGGFKVENVAKDEWQFQRPLKEDDENNNKLEIEDLQGKLSVLRQAVDDIGDAISTLMNQSATGEKSKKDDRKVEKQKNAKTDEKTETGKDKPDKEKKSEKSVKVADKLAMQAEKMAEVKDESQDKPEVMEKLAISVAKLDLLTEKLENLKEKSDSPQEKAENSTEKLENAEEKPEGKADKLEEEAGNSNEDSKNSKTKSQELVEEPGSDMTKPEKLDEKSEKLMAKAVEKHEASTSEIAEKPEGEKSGKKAKEKEADMIKSQDHVEKPGNNVTKPEKIDEKSENLIEIAVKNREGFTSEITKKPEDEKSGEKAKEKKADKNKAKRKLRKKTSESEQETADSKGDN